MGNKTALDIPQKGLSRTWLVAVMRGEVCIFSAEITGSRNYIPWLIEACHILTTTVHDLDQYEILSIRDTWSRTLQADDIRKFAMAWNEKIAS